MTLLQWGRAQKTHSLDTTGPITSRDLTECAQNFFQTHQPNSSLILPLLIFPPPPCRCGARGREVILRELPLYGIMKEEENKISLNREQGYI